MVEPGLRPFHDHRPLDPRATLFGPPLLRYRVSNAVRGTFYLVSYFAAVLVAPVMVLTAGIDLALARLGATKKGVSAP